MLACSFLCLCLTLMLFHLSMGGALELSVRLVSRTPPDVLHDELMIRSTPGSQRLRQHMSREELKYHTASSEACKTAVVEWLEMRGASNVRLGVMEDHMFFSLPGTAEVEKLFGLPVSPAPRFGRQHLTVPTALEQCVRFVFWSNPKSEHPKRSRLSNNEFPGMDEDPSTIASRYQVPSSPVIAPSTFAVGVAEFEGEQFYQSNIDAFNARYGYPNNTIQISGPNHGGYFGEGNMDLEYIQTIAAGVPTWWIAEKDFDFAKWTENVLSIHPMPLVLSISWGSGESGFDNVTMQSDSEEFRKLGLLGATIFSASGDQGTGTTGFFSCGTFDPTWPASSPYVTAVGGTYADSANASEISWSGSGGGFSTVFDAPTYQTTAVAHYTSASVMPPSEYYRIGGRGIPDVAALSCNFEVYSEGWGTETGTSAATPTFAAVVARINAHRLENRKPALGFLNPALYSIGHVGFDVIDGNNKVSACPAGFSAAVGWDAISGLGTPLYSVLSAALSE